MMEKSGCLQLTRGELHFLRTYIDSFSNPEGHIKFAAEAMNFIDKTGIHAVDLKKILDSGEYRIVED